jgi:hypothetical protein
VVKPEPVIRFETDPGRQMQADFATIRRGRDRLSNVHCDVGLESGDLRSERQSLELEFGGYISAILT